MRILADLHLHSTASDGRCSPAEVVRLSKAAGATVIALTDHDTLAGIDEALAEAARQGGITVIPGVELSTAENGQDRHLLVYNPDRRHPTLQAFLREGVKQREARNRRLLRRLQQAGYDITEAALREGSVTVTRAHFARWMVSHGHAESVGEAIDRYFRREQPFFEPIKRPTLREAIAVAKAAGGHPVLAHPKLYTALTAAEYEADIRALAAAGLEGIEAHHPAHTPAERQYWESVAAACGLFVSGGSDFHGSNKPDIAVLVGKGDLAYDGRLYPYLTEPIKE